MKIKGLIEYDICNYSKPSMFIIFPKCSFKCDHECGMTVCQNSSLAKEPEIEIPIEEIVDRYLNNPLTHAFVFGGLEPFDSMESLLPLINCIRAKYRCDDDIVIYTGYTEKEFTKEGTILADYYQCICKFYKNIIIKFGRFQPNQEPHFDEILGVELASPNQYAKRITGESLNEN